MEYRSKRFVLALNLLMPAMLAAQDPPPVRETTRIRPPGDTLRPTVLDPIRAQTTRIERVQFEAAPNVGIVSMTGKELALAPRFFAEADLLRSLQLRPGVEARNDFNAGLSVRGGESDQNLVLLDGYPIYNPFHLGGLFGTFQQPMVGRVDLLTGGYPSPYGGRLSSVVDVRSAEEMRSGIHGTADVSLLASSASLGSSLGGGRGSWMIAARRTYIDRAVSTFTPEELPYDFRDVQTRPRPFPARFATSMTMKMCSRLDGGPR
jgi:hypothetical protein